MRYFQLSELLKTPGRLYVLWAPACFAVKGTWPW